MIIINRGVLEYVYIWGGSGVGDASGVESNEMYAGYCPYRWKATWRVPAAPLTTETQELDGNSN